MKDLNDSFREFLTWYKVLNRDRLCKILEEALPDTKSRLIYQLTSVDRSANDIESISEKLGVKVPKRTISSWQVSWIKTGLVKAISAYKRERIFDLQDFGIDIGIDFSILEELE